MSVCHSESITSELQQRDEVAEIKKLSQKDTNKVRLWRICLLVALSVTAVLVSRWTYNSLKDDETERFRVSFAQVSETLGSAAQEQQVKIQQALQTLETVILTSAENDNASYPTYLPQDFEYFMKQAREHGDLEIVTIGSVVQPEEETEYLAYMNATRVQKSVAGHMLEYGHTDFLTDQNYLGTFGYLNASYMLDRQKPGTFPITIAAQAISPPTFDYSLINGNYYSIPYWKTSMMAAMELRNITFSGVFPYATKRLSMTPETHEAMHSKLKDSSIEFPHTHATIPVRRELRDEDSDIVAFVTASFAWDAAWRNLVPEGVKPVIAVLENTCWQKFTYSIEGPDAIFIGNGDQRENTYDSERYVVQIQPNLHPNYTDHPGICEYTMTLYPTKEFEESFRGSAPMTSAIMFAVTFASITLIFIVYDIFVSRRNRALIANAAKSNAVVTAMFPGAMRDKFMDMATGDQAGVMSQMKSFLSNDVNEIPIMFDTKPLAELFLETTVMFADISGFTAWSSVREPSQVFTLLENIYNAFDLIARRRRIYKVETVGDCYVAVAGLPEHREDHAVAMVRFAKDCIISFNAMVTKLEVLLGPDTSDLKIRIGIHSGPVTAGVLRGERSRFQLFGDTMNVASRIEHTGQRNRVHVSSSTADELRKAGRSNWLVKRTDKVDAKGIGTIETYWIDYGSKNKDADTASEASSRQMDDDPLMDTTREERLVEWHTETMIKLIKQIVVRRRARGLEPDLTPQSALDSLAQSDQAIFLNEVKEVIELPEFDANASEENQVAFEVDLKPEVTDQLRHFVQGVALLYRANPFHSFEHASHVTMSVIKLLSRIVQPSDVHVKLSTTSNDKEQTLHDHTYGITSDPLTQFACAFSALIHDVDHTGVPNSFLIQENPVLSKRFLNRSVAEQNSLQLSWMLLMENDYADLRLALFGTKAEMQRFRELVVNSVMATDIADKELKQLRNQRWEKAFSESDDDLNVNRKATIVIEHLIQASDVSHTMQHWHIYRKWNEKLFEEMYLAYKEGRMPSNPADNWAKGEIGFFDFYIIPLAKKLKDCGVFGVSSDEYLNYALQNRREWELRGADVVAEMVERLG